MADEMENRANRLKAGRKSGANVGALVGIALLSGLGLGGAGVVYLSKASDATVVPTRPTSNSQEFQVSDNVVLRSQTEAVPTFVARDTGPSEKEIELQARLAEAELALVEARSQQAAVPDTSQLETLQKQLNDLSNDMAERSVQITSLTTERDSLALESTRKDNEIEGMLLQMQQADENSLEDARASEEALARQQELERRRADALAIAQAQINSPIDGMSSGGADTEARDYTGDEAFVRAGSDTISATQSRVIGSPSNTVMQGTVIEATLTTGINSSLSGTVASTVSYDIWSFDMSRVLIPRGSQMFGRYSSEVALGQSRVLVAWDRVVTPNGQVVDLEAYGSDRLGRSGLTGKVNSRFGQRFGSAALISVFAAAPTIAAANLENENAATLADAVGNDASDSVSGVIEQYLALAPIITVEHGSVIMVMVTNDLEMF